MINQIYIEAGIRIQQLRDKRGYTRESLATKADISDKFLYEIETGKKGFSAEVLYSIATALNVNCDYILTGGHKEVNYDPVLLETLELFEEDKTNNVIKLLEIVHDMLEQN